MISDDPLSDTFVDDRLRFVTHKGQVIFVIDFSRCKGKQLLDLVETVKIIVARHAPGSMLTLADFSGAEIDKKIATRMKEVLVLDRPYVKKAAFVGTEHLPQVFYENFKNFSRRDLPIFKTKEEAMDWLVAE